ncbi:MAG: Ig-like domain-containing protein, partial [Chloroflexota bacterium]
MAIVLTSCGEPEPPETVLPTLAPIVEQPTVEPTPTATAVPQLDESVIDWPPQVIFTSPAVGEPALLDGAITIRFDQAMDQASVEAAFDVSLTTGDKVSGQFAWPRPDTVLFTPESVLEPTQQLTVQIGETAVSTNGLTLPEAIRYELETVGFLQVGQVVPAQDTLNVLPDSPITIFFNKPVVPLTSTDQQDNLPQPLQISPAVEGKGSWISTSVYQFKPRTVLDGATTYTVSVDPSLVDITNGRLQQSFSWQFSTISPSVLNITPRNGETLILPDDPLQIEFNMPMDIESAENAIELRGGTADLSFAWSEDARSVTLTPETLLDLDASYELTVDTSALAANGNAGLAETAVSLFQTVPFPAILGTFPANGTIADRFQQGVTIQFASPMDLETLEDQIAIRPEPEGSIDYFFNRFSNELSIQFEYTPSERYSVTVPRGAADLYGNTIGEPFGFVFTTPPRAPVLSFNLPQNNIAQLSSSFVTRADLIHVNVSDATVELYDIGLPLGLLNRFSDISDYRPAALPLRSWELELDTAENEAGVVGLQLSESGALPPGIYLLTAQSADLTDESRFWQNQRQVVVVSDTNIVVKHHFDAVYVWATDLRSGQPAPNLSLSLYDDQGVLRETAVSDSNGFATFDYDFQGAYLNSVTVVANEPGQVGFGVASSLWIGNSGPWNFDIPNELSNDREQFVYIYTDRPIYRPGDTVYFKGIARDNQYSRHSLPTFNLVPVTLSFSGFADGESYSEQVDVSLSENGTFSGEFTLPEDLAVGNYGLTISQEGLYVEYRIVVAEYRRPELIVAFVEELNESLRGEAATLELSADYFFGGPAIDLPVQWTATAVSNNFNPIDNFDPFAGSFSSFLGSGEGVTDENGRFQIELSPELLDDVQAGTVIVLVEATVTDLSNLTISTRTDFTFHAAETYVSIQASPFVLSVGQTADLLVKTTDWAGLAMADQLIELTYFSREWVSTSTTNFAGYTTAWEAIDTELGSETVITNGFGEATTTFTPETGGSLVVKAVGTDRTGRTFTSERTLWVGGVNGVGWRLDPRNKLLNIRVDKEAYRVGDTAELLIESPFDEPVQAWLTIERGDLINQQLITLNGNSELLTIPISEAYAPNVFVMLTAVKPFNPDDSETPQADLRYGVAELIVNPEQFVLDVTLTPQADNLEPGETAVFDIQVTDSNGNPVAAELSLALVDKAILTLREDTALPIDEAFYMRQPLRSRLGSGLFLSGENLPLEVPLEILGRGGGGGGGGGFAAETAADGAIAKSSEFEDEAARSEFPDTAYWEAVVNTDAAGQATVTIELPDTLTTWVLRSKAVTENTQIGEAEAEIVTTLPLIVRPVTPRFLTVGDVVQLSAIVNNNTDAALETAVSIQVAGVQLNDDATQTVTVPANGQTVVQWQITVPDDAPFADFTFRAEAGELVDITKPSFGVGPNNQIPIYQYTARDIVGTSG